MPFNFGKLILSIKDQKGNPLADTADITLENRTITHRVEKRNADAALTHVFEGLIAVPQGLYVVGVMPQRHEYTAEFVTILSQGDTVKTITVPTSGSPTLPPQGGITLDDLGNLSVVPTTRIARRGELIRWESYEGPFALHFNETTPFGRVVLQSKQAAAPFSVEAIVRSDTPFATYEYAVAVSKNNRVWFHFSGEVRVEDWF
jgi:hypothetical protein